jgi:predicted XRE-type DNA-binding protein
MTKKKIGYEVGSGNVFADLGLPNAEEHLIKAQLVYKIDTLMKERRLKQVEAAQLFGVRQPDISKMLRGDFRQFVNRRPTWTPGEEALTPCGQTFLQKRGGSRLDADRRCRK